MVPPLSSSPLPSTASLWWKITIEAQRSSLHRSSATSFHHLPGGAILFDEGSDDGWSDDLVGGDGHPVGLTEAHNQSWKPPRPYWTSLVPLSVLRARSLQTVNGIRNQLSHVHTYLCHDGINQLTLGQGEIGVVVARQNVAR